MINDSDDVKELIGNEMTEISFRELIEVLVSFEDVFKGFAGGNDEDNLE